MIPTNIKILEQNEIRIRSQYLGILFKWSLQCLGTVEDHDDGPLLLPAGKSGVVYRRGCSGVGRLTRQFLYSGPTHNGVNNN